ncbi:TPA: hypothetical protein ACPZMX_002120 [Yersinia enterocolitica]
MKKNTFFHIDGTISGLLSICALATLAFSLAMPGRFFTENTFLSIAFQLPELGLLTFAMFVPMLSGGLNLSIIGTAIRTDRVMIAIYSISSLLCVLAGLIMMSRFNSARMGYGDSYLLLTVLAIVLGGTNPFGGVGKVSHVFCALLVLQVIATGLSLLGVSLHFNLAVWGITLIFALAFKFFKEKWKAKRAMKNNRLKHLTEMATGRAK